MSEAVQTKTTIEVPPLLSSVFEQLVADFAARHGESPESARRAVEIALVQRGLAALQVDANKGFGERMGWPKEEETTA